MAFRSTSIGYIIRDQNRTHAEKLSIAKDKIRRTLFGSRARTGVIAQIFVYTLLSAIGFVYLYPLLYMFVTSIKSLEDLLNISVRWLPSAIYIQNYLEALTVLDFGTTILQTFYVTMLPSSLQVAVCASVGYGFARYNFKFKGLFMLLMIFSFIIPPQILMMPVFVLYTDLGLIGSVRSLVIPAILGQGFMSVVFILIFYQMFRQMPQSLFEAAQIDGAGHIQIFLRIGLPSVVSAGIVVFLFSFVWYWNETFLMSLFLGNPALGIDTSLTTVLLELERFEASFATLYPITQNVPQRINEGIEMAGTMISIAPLLIIYFLLQDHFIESVDRTGITGE